MLFAHLKRILRLGRLRLRGPAGARFEFTLAAIAQNLRAGAPSTQHGRTMRCVSGVRRVGCVRHQCRGVSAAHAGRRPRDREPKFSDLSLG